MILSNATETEVTNLIVVCYKALGHVDLVEVLAGIVTDFDTPLQCSTERNR